MKKLILMLLVFVCITTNSTIQAQRKMEKLTRGLVAVRTSSNSVFLSWRVLGSDPDNVGFHLYRDGVKITLSPITNSSNYSDATSNASSYIVKPVINGVETGESYQTNVMSNFYLDVPISIPDSMTMPDGTRCGYDPHDISIGDVDADGDYELVVKWDPTNMQDNSNDGYTGNVYLDCYKLNGTKLWRIDLGKNMRAGKHYTQVQMADYDGDGKAEVACKTAPGTKDGTGNYLSKGPALTDNDASDYRNSSGYILSGPEYLTVFSGLSGAELATVNYNPPRGNVSSWGDSYGNRVDRFLACSPYLDGLKPSLVMCRGYYTRVVLTAWDFKDGALTQRWVYDSNTPNGANAQGQGNHNLSVGDIDDDGKDEIVYGASAFDDNGKCLYKTGLGHGDAMHLSDLDPDRKGLEVWQVLEESGVPYRWEMHDAKTGQILWGAPLAGDNGRGLAANVDASSRGFEMWSAMGPGVSSVKGVTLNTTTPSINFRVYWDGDLQDELLDKLYVFKYGAGTILNGKNYDCMESNGTKATPCLSADLFGDWREEIIWRTNDNARLRIFTTTIPTTNKLYTLMHDAQYRNSIVWQNVAYSQPPHCGFYVGDDMDPAPVSTIYDNEKRWKNGTSWDNNISSSFTDSIGGISTFKNNDKVLFDITAGSNASVVVQGDLTPGQMKVNSPYQVELNGTGTLTGNMDLKKIGSGTLVFNNNNNYSGSSKFWCGEFYNNGILENSDVYSYSFVKIGGKGVFGGNVYLGNNSIFTPGSEVGVPAKVTFLKNLSESGSVSYNIDFKVENGVVLSNDTIVINGNWNLSGKSIITLNISGGNLPAGKYIFAKCKGVLSGNLNAFKIIGLPSTMSYALSNIGGDIQLSVKAPTQLIWQANVDSKWDNAKTDNWLNLSSPSFFMTNDSVLFNESGTSKSVLINESVIPALTVVDASSNYTFSGTGSIEGTGSLIKNGSGKLTLSNINKYTGKTIINNGIVEISSLSNGGVASALGAATNIPSNIVLDGGKLHYTGASVVIDRGFTLGPSDGAISVNSANTTLTTTGKITGTGGLIKEGAGKLSLSVANDYRGGTAIKGGTIALTTDLANTSGLGIADTTIFQNGTLIMFDSKLTENVSNWNLRIPQGYTGTLVTDGLSTISGSIAGGGVLNYYTSYTGNVLASNVSKYMGTLNITTDADGGLFNVYNSNGYSNAKINLNNLVTMIYRVTSNISIPIGELTGQTNSVLGAGGTGLCKITWEIGNRNANSSFNGTITNTQYSGTGAVAAIRKVGTGVWTLTGANTYTGSTVISGGTIMVNNITGSGLGTGTVTVNSGGILAGNGSISGSVLINEGGTISPSNGIGTLTVNNQVTIQPGGSLAIDVDKTTAKSDLLTLTGTLNMAGKLKISELNSTAFSNGDSFKIISGNIVGTPTEIIPASPGTGLEWDLSEFISSGIIKVKLETGINDVQLAGKVYPNPFKNELTIQTDEPLQNAILNIFNVIGETVYSSEFSFTDKIELNLRNLTSGVYLLRINDGEKEISQKILKQ